MYTVGSVILKKQNELQSNGRGRRRGQRKGAVGEESTRQLREEQTLLWGFVLYAFCGIFYIAFRQFSMCKRNREIRSGWIKVCSSSFITKHTLLAGDEKQTLGAQPAIYTSGGCVHTGHFLQPRERLFSWLLFELSCYFHGKEKVQSE